MRAALLLSALAALLVGAIALGLALGSVESPSREILLEIRLPRVVLGALVGAGLATAGALLQALLQNPLADPYILGISGGAALGGVLGIAFGFGVGASTLGVPLLAFGGALGSTVLLYAVAGRAARNLPHSLLLSGVIFNAFAASVIVFLTTLTDVARMAGIFLWLIGSIRLVDARIVAGVAALLALGLAVGIRDSYALNLVSLGEEQAAQLGVDVRRVRRRVLCATALMIGAAVSVSGLIGFVGLLMPHVLRMLLGADHRLLVPACALGGAAFLVVSDTFARTLLAPTELPVGAITALLGGPLFLALLRRDLARGVS